MNYNYPDYFNNIIYKLRVDINMLRKERDDLTMKNVYINNNIQKETKKLRDENIKLNQDFNEMKMLYNKLWEKNKATEDMILNMHTMIFKMRDFQAQDYIARQELKKQFELITND